MKETANQPCLAARPEKRPKVRCGIDTGGTFTDLIGLDEGSGDLIVGKFPSSPKYPVKSIVGVIAESRLDVSHTAFIVLGTTLGLNALLQRKGARVIFVTSYFGSFSLQGESKLDEGRIEASIECASARRPERIELRLPHPQGQSLTKVKGGSYSQETENVTIDSFSGRAGIELVFGAQD